MSPVGRLSSEDTSPGSAGGRRGQVCQVCVLPVCRRCAPLPTGDRAMPLRLVLRYLASDRVVERLSHWWPVRWAARRVADGLVRSVRAAEQVARSEAAQSARRRSASFRATFSEELRRGFEEMNRRNKT
ncbi:hypothetical protein FJT64_000595 [Amphibalanus amphitrite]|uniref:Uncharacterized protein n=1 Tax=Amphibalanus amphitrite TaxID=1232801 RepID=A0A6A4VPL4_AMPAM|nr:hypothetical protein FJT64_000595 [Amphibalanus amphitrite]